MSMVRHMPVASTSSVPAPPAAAPAPPAATATSSSTKVPGFLLKLWAMVEDPAVDHLICWNDAADGFIVVYPEGLARELLPRFFKHSNFGSFVRQLNMYGFNKVLHMQQGVLKNEPGDNSESLEFKNDNFKKGHQELLHLIHRKKPVSAANAAGEERALSLTNTGANSSANANALAVDLHTILTDIATVRQHQTAITAELQQLAESNKQLWSEAIESRQRHKTHQDTINKILRFLGTVFGGKVLSPGGQFEEAEVIKSPISRPSPTPSDSTSNSGTTRRLPKKQRLLLKNVPENEDDGTSPRVREIEVPTDELNDLPLIGSQDDSTRFRSLTDSPQETPIDKLPNFNKTATSQALTPIADRTLQELFSPATTKALFNFNPPPSNLEGSSDEQNQQLQKVMKDHASINAQMDALQSNLDRLVAGLNIPPDQLPAVLGGTSSSTSLNPVASTSAIPYSSADNTSNQVLDYGNFTDFNFPPLDSASTAPVDDNFDMDAFLKQFLNASTPSGSQPPAIQGPQHDTGPDLFEGINFGDLNSTSAEYPNGSYFQDGKLLTEGGEAEPLGLDALLEPDVGEKGVENGESMPKAKRSNSMVSESESATGRRLSPRKKKKA